MNPEDDPLEQLKALKAAPSEGDPLEELKKLKAPHRPKIGQMGIPISDDSPEDASYAQQALGGIAALARNIPGAEAAQAGARSFFRAHPTGKPNAIGFQPTERDQPYTEALSDVRQAEESAPKWVRRGNRLAGGAIAAAAAPAKILGTGGSIAMQGARFGAAEGLLSADPQSTRHRLVHAGIDAATTALAGKLLGEFVPNVVRTLRAKPLGEVALGKTAQMESADAAAYGKAALEGAGKTHPDVTKALTAPDIQPYVAIIKRSRTLQGADDATVLREAYKLMSERQGILGKRVINADDFKAGSALEQADISAGKRELLNAGEKVMPSLRPAVYGHAEAKRGIDAFRAAADATDRIVRNASVAGRKLDKNSPEAFRKSIHLMSEQEAKSALEGALGRLQSKIGLTLNPLKGFGIPKSVSSINKLAPYLETLDAQAGNVGGHLRRALAIALSPQ